ncbi:MAG: polysaccharide biosynthesis protein [Hyphomonadaceae bacterium]|nr:polysaccharide biosynthesis protein [Hyphomonadaceae bacterium]
MTQDAILVGLARAVRDAVEARACSFGSVLVVGAGDPGTHAARRVSTWEQLDFRTVEASSILLAAPPANGAEARVVLERAAHARLKVSLIENSRARRLTLEDLVGQRLRDADAARIQPMIRGKRVLITGGGGSIGAALARRVMDFSPARLAILDSSEFNLFRISQDLAEATPILADIRDQHAVRRWFARERPEIVFHAAALKQVPLVEAFASEGVMTNIVGLRHVAEASAAAGADMVFVSTDKAVEPSGVMGATKRFGEMYCQALDRLGPRRIVPVRLGNVLGSTGSVAPTFVAQLAAGGPLTVTHPDVTRFFLTIPQAAESLLQAAAVALAGEERGAAYTLDMGEALPVVELAREVIRLEGLRPDDDVPITFTGLRPGEKLHEALIGADETRADPAPGVMAAFSTPRGLPELHEQMERLVLHAREGAKSAIRDALFAAIEDASQRGSDRERALVG